MTATRLYHILPSPCAGTVLYPLNQLKRIDADRYQAHRRKYRGREALLHRIIPPLNCLWNDVLHFSPVHPALLRDLKRDVGLSWPAGGRDIAAINPAELEFNETNTTIWIPRPKKKGDFWIDPAEFLPFDIDQIRKLRDLPDITRTHYADCARNGTQPFLFVGIPHILHLGRLRLTDCQIIRI